MLAGLPSMGLLHLCLFYICLFLTCLLPMVMGMTRRATDPRVAS